MSVEDLESLQSLQEMCTRSNKAPQECPMDVDDSTIPDTRPAPAPVPDTDTAQVFDLNDLLYLALQIEDQAKYNKSEFLG